MKALVVETPFGVLAFDEEGKLIEKVPFQKKPQAAAKALVKMESGKITDEVALLIELLQKKGCDTFIFERNDLANDARNKLGVTIETAMELETFKKVRSDAETFAVEAGFVKTAEDFRSWMHSVTMEITKIKVRGAVEKRDLVVAQAILALDDLEKVTNLFMNRIREWYGIHFPELDRLVEKHETYARLVMNLGNRDNFTVESLEREGIPKAKSEAIIKTIENSMGADTATADLKVMQTMCERTLGLYELKQSLESYLDATMEEVAPNMKSLVGSLLGARLIAITGGLSNLAKKPASTVQVLGAEKALFRSLKTGTRPPKHGLIFQHALLHDAKKWQRGKIARALAGKLAIAARSDAYSGRHIGEELKASLNKRIEEIHEKYVEPPPFPQPRFEERKVMREKRRRNRRER